MKHWLFAFGLSLLSPAALAQDWGNLDRLLFQSLTESGTAEASFWLPNAPDPAVATTAIGVVYEYIPGSAGNTGIATGVFVRQANGWSFAGEVDGMYGQSPRDAAYFQGGVDVTTSMPGPNDARCCPTMPTRWRIDLGRMKAVKIR
ncbi:MAG: hypothetical protein WA790_08515 [Sulfitobacter sp.]